MAQTYKFGKDGTWATKKGSTLAYSDTNNAFKPLPFNFTRNSIATRVNKEGLIEVVGNDIPRIDYTDSADGVLLLEPSRSNIALESNQFNESEWSKTNTSVSANETGVGGSTNAWLLSKSSSDALIRQFITTTGANTFSVYVKKGTLSWVKLFIASSTESSSVYVNLNNGSTGTSSGTPTVKVVPMDNGWYRCIITKDTTNINNFRIYPADADNDTSGTSGNIYIQYAQVEVGNVASSYIPTNGSIIQRAAETCNDSGNSEVFNNVEGTIFINANFVSNSGVQVLCSVHDFATNKRLEIWANSNLINGFIGGSSSITVGSSNLINGSHKIALNYKSGNSSFYVDGFLIGSSSTTFTIAELTKMTLGYFIATQYKSESPTKEIGYYDEILTDEELEYMTSYRSLNEMVTELNLNAL